MTKSIVQSRHNPLKYIAALCFSISTLFIAGNAHALLVIEGGGSRVFANPRVGGLPLDWCLNFGTGCGAPAANAYCQSKGYNGAVNYAQRPYVSFTRTVGTGQTCRNNCDSFRWIRCGSNQQRVYFGGGYYDNIYYTPGWYGPSWPGWGRHHHSRYPEWRGGHHGGYGPRHGGHHGGYGPRGGGGHHHGGGHHGGGGHHHGR